MGCADLAVECDSCKTDILEQTILVCKKWLANRFAANTLLEDLEQELILAFQRYWTDFELYKDLPEKILNAEATVRLGNWQLAQVENSLNLREVESAEFHKDLAEFEKDRETIKREKEAGIEPDQKKVVLCENKLNELRARAFSNKLKELRASLDKAAMTNFLGQVSLEWLREQLDQQVQKLTELEDNLCIIGDRINSGLEPLLLQFAMSGAAIDQEIEQLVPSLSQHHQVLVYAWLQSKWEVREGNWGTLYGKLKTSTNEQRVETFRNQEQPVTPVVVPADPVAVKSTGRRGRLPKDESELLETSMVAQLREHPTLADDPERLALLVGVSSSTARRLIDKERKKYGKLKRRK